MTCLKRTLGTAALISVLGVTQTIAQPLPPLVRNLPQAQDSDITREALANRVERAYPRDIGSTMLVDLMEMDGFEVEDSDAGITASVRVAEYPCITDYIVTWDETDRRKVANLRATLERKCV